MLYNMAAGDRSPVSTTSKVLTVQGVTLRLILHADRLLTEAMLLMLTLKVRFALSVSI